MPSDSDIRDAREWVFDLLGRTPAAESIAYEINRLERENVRAATEAGQIAAELGALATEWPDQYGVLTGLAARLERIEGQQPPRVFTCPRCGMTSAHPKDVEQGYCGNCHDWTKPSEVTQMDAHDLGETAD